MPLAISAFLEHHSAVSQRVSAWASIPSTCIVEYNIFAGEAQTSEMGIFCFTLAPAQTAGAAQVKAVVLTD
jgi:hypothetical protein